MLNLINYEQDKYIIHYTLYRTLYAKDPYEANYQILINKRESTGVEYLNNSKAFIEYSSGMDDIYKNIEDYNLIKQPKILIVFDYMIADMLSNEKT